VAAVLSDILNFYFILCTGYKLLLLNHLVVTSSKASGLNMFTGGILFDKINVNSRFRLYDSLRSYVTVRSLRCWSWCPCTTQCDSISGLGLGSGLV